MFKIIAVLLALTSLLTAKDDSVNYWENDGIVAIEIETVPCEKSWQKEISMKGFTGECYYTWKGANKLIFFSKYFTKNNRICL